MNLLSQSICSEIKLRLLSTYAARRCMQYFNDFCYITVRDLGGKLCRCISRTFGSRSLHGHSLDFSPKVVSLEATVAKFRSLAQPMDGYKDPKKYHSKEMKSCCEKWVEFYVKQHCMQHINSLSASIISLSTSMLVKR